MVNDSFLTRWSKRKLEGDKEAQSADTKAELDTDELNSDAASNHITENISEEKLSSDVETKQVNGEDYSLASLLTSEADKEIKKAALRKLFLGGEFSEVCRMNDYAQDFSSIKPLSPEVAQTLRGWLKESTENSEQQGELLTENQPAMDEIIDGSTVSETDLDSLDQADSIENEVEPLAEHSQFEGETKNTI